MAKAFEAKMCTAISAKLEALSNLKIDKKKNVYGNLKVRSKSTC